MIKTKLQTLRESKGLTIETLAARAEREEAKSLKTTYSVGGALHYERVIRVLEGAKLPCPKIRKTIECRFIAKVLKCDRKDIEDD